MPEFVIAHILDRHKVGDMFTMWPLHITVVPPFEAPSLEDVIDVFEPIISQALPVHLHLGGLANLGARKHKPAQLLIPHPKLSTLRYALLETAEDHGWDVSTSHAGLPFQPHITRNAGRIYTSREVQLSSLSIVEAKPMGYRQIKAEIPMEGRAAA